MALVDYGSSDSEQEPPKLAAPPRDKTTKSSKPAFENLVDKSNPSLIRVSVAQETAKPIQEDARDGPEPPAKRAKTSTFGGFNSFLPAPKRAASTAGGLGKGVSLKTGAAPGFTREPMPETPSHDQSPERSNKLEADETTDTTTTVTNEKSSAISDGVTAIGADEQSKKKSTIFKPLSVARKPGKKRLAPTQSQSTVASMSKADTIQPKAAPKVSLFSVGDVSDTISTPAGSSSTYQPLVYHADPPDELELNSDQAYEQGEPLETSSPQPTLVSLNQIDSLDSVAADLNLSASARRQLMGRHQRDSRNSSIKVTNFNTDQEYAANEALRQSGEIVQHNAVRGIAPGKHSLKQLVNAATTQKDALEEQFAAGRRNKSEAGAKYGW